jgi:hypothetical protein
MCFIIFSESIPNQAILTEFDQILPYPAPLKINGIYDDILTFWNPQHQSESRASSSSSDSKLLMYLDSLLSDTPTEISTQEGSTDSSPLHYDLYVSTFQFQYRPALMGKNGSENLLQKTSQNIFTYVTNNLYYDTNGSSQASFSSQQKNTWTQYLQPLAEFQLEQDDPCSYQLIDYSLRDVCLVSPPLPDSSRTISSSQWSRWLPSTMPHFGLAALRICFFSFQLNNSFQELI